MKKIFLFLMVISLVSCGKEASQSNAETSGDTITIAPQQAEPANSNSAQENTNSTQENTTSSVNNSTAPVNTNNEQAANEPSAANSNTTNTNAVHTNGVQTKAPIPLPKDAVNPSKPMVNPDNPFRGYMAEYTMKVNEYIAMATRAKKGDKEAARLYGPIYAEIMPLQKKIEALQLSIVEMKHFQTIKKRFTNISDNME